LYVEAQLSGVTRKVGRTERFLAQAWHVDERELSQNVAPYLVHTLDAYFNALVIEELRDEGAENIVAIHDSWFVPRFVLDWNEKAFRFYRRLGAKPAKQWVLTRLSGKPLRALAAQKRI